MRRARKRRLLAPADDRVERVFLGSSGDYSASLLTKRHPQLAAVKAQFLSEWRKSVATGGRVLVQRVYAVRNPPQIYERFRAHSRAVGNVQHLFHGTQQAEGCGFGSDLGAAPCDARDCRLCNILRTSFSLRHAGSVAARPAANQRYGAGLYFSACSGKANDYASDRVLHGKVWGAIFLCKVAVGTSYETEDDFTLDGFPAAADGAGELPPPGFDSVCGVVGRRLNYPETVVYDERACVPSFLVIYTTAD